MEKELLLLIKQELTDLKELLIKNGIKSPVSENWIAIEDLKEWINYGNTQMCEFLKTKDLIVSQFGRRKFVRKDSLEKLLENGIMNKS